MSVLLAVALGCSSVWHDYRCDFDTVHQSCTMTGPAVTMTVPAPSRVIYRDPTRHVRIRLICRPQI
jgi:hypothetical protein